MEDAITYTTDAPRPGPEFYKAFGVFQAAAPMIEKTATNPHFKNKYAPLDAVVEKIRPTLTDAGLVVLQTTDEYDGTVVLTTSLVHAESGQGIRSLLSLLPSKKDAQGIGAALTYARRYALVTILGLATEDDDDGNAAAAPRGEQTQSRSRSQSSSKPKAENAPTDEQKARLVDAIATGQAFDPERFSSDKIDELAKKLTGKPLADLGSKDFERVLAKVETAAQGEA